MIDSREYTHPSYGLVSLSRVQANKSNCFMADGLEVGRYIKMTVSTAFLSRKLSGYNLYPDKNILSLRMSYHQFAELITNFNNGSGTACTLEWITPAGQGKVEEYVSPPSVRSEFELDLRKQLDQANKILKELKDSIAELVNKGKAGKTELKQASELVNRVERQLFDSTPYIEKRFGEALDNATSRSKAEITAWMDAQLSRMGLESLQQKQIMSGSSPAPLETDKPAGDLTSAIGTAVDSLQ